MKNAGKAVDWWSLGTLMYEMLTGWPPFYDKNMRTMCEKILTGRLKFPAHIAVSAAGKHLIAGFLTRDPSQRIGSRPRKGPGHPGACARATLLLLLPSRLARALSRLA